MTRLIVKNKPENSSNVWLTPPEIIKSLGEFDLDPCAAINQPWDTANSHFTINDDGLSKHWSGRVWLNPPYSNTKILNSFLKKMAEHNYGTAFLFARTDTKYWHKYIFPYATGLLFLKGRVTFYRPSGKKGKSNGGAPSVLISYGEYDWNMLNKSSLEGKRVKL